MPEAPAALASTCRAFSPGAGGIPSMSLMWTMKKGAREGLSAQSGRNIDPGVAKGRKLRRCVVPSFDWLPPVALRLVGDEAGAFTHIAKGHGDPLAVLGGEVIHGNPANERPNQGGG